MATSDSNPTTQAGAAAAMQPASAWAPYVPDEAMPWNVARVVHLHRRATFAATWGEIRRDLADGPDAAIARILSGACRLDGLNPGFDSIAEAIGNGAVASGDIQRLRAWWSYRMLFTPDPLTERLALMWHNHFATSVAKVKDLGLMRRQNEAHRRLARAPFAEMLDAMLADPAMLVWLDAPSNQRGAPNENLGRELMELFTLGVGHYSEHDVKEAARALTGLSVVDGEAAFRRQYHDVREKKILGHRGRYDPKGLAKLLLEQPATSHRLAWRLCQTFMGEGVVPPAALDELAAGLRAHDLEIGWAVETVLRSRAFFAPANIASRVAGPIEFMVATARSMEAFDPPPSTLLLGEWSSRLGQELFAPPNVGGWSGGRAWLTSRSIIARANFAAAVVTGELTAEGKAMDLQALARRHGAGATSADAFAFFRQLLLGGRSGGELLKTAEKQLIDASLPEPDRLRRAVALVLASPEAQLC